MEVIPTLRNIIRKQLISPIQEFIKDSRAVGITLLACTILSLVLANSSVSANYIQLIETEFHFPSCLHLPQSILHLINDALMALFFFLVGMEIKRELLIGELSSVKKAALPIAAALGGMVVPAFIFIALNAGRQVQGQPLSVSASMEKAASDSITREFGDGFADSLRTLPQGRWSGPIQSGFGWHAVRVRDIIASGTPPLSDIRQRVSNDWRAETQATREAAAYQALLDGYDIRIAKP